ncbi:hypothetical protein MRX96_017080 [Rhipicephalus microplus]
MNLGTQDAEVESFYQLGKVLERPEDDPEETQDGAELVYDQLSEKNAALLRRILSAGPPVLSLHLCRISLRSFKVAFDGLEECPWLEELAITIDCKGKDLDTNLTGLIRELHSLKMRCENPGIGYAKDVACYIRQGKYLTELSLGNSCGCDEGVAVLTEALAENETIKTFSLDDMNLSSDTIIAFANVLASNSTLEVVDIREVCPVEKDIVLSLLKQERYANVFKRLQIVWPEELLPELTTLVRRQMGCPRLSVTVTSSVDEAVLGEFFDAVVADKTLCGLTLLPLRRTFNALANGIASLVRRTKTLREIWVTHYVEQGDERHVVCILDALRENRSVTQFTMYAQTLTPELATSLSELLAANDTLNDFPPSRRLREKLREEAILNRNTCLSKKAVEFVVSGADVSDEKGVDALNKVHSSTDLVEEVQRLTGKTEEAAPEAIQSALSCISA